MRLITYLFNLAMLLVVAGSVTATAQQAAPTGHHDTEGQGNAACVEERLVQNSLVDEAGNYAGLDPDRISILNWNVYKGQRENWATDFKRYAYRHDVVTIQEAHLDDELASMLDAEHQYWTLNAAFDYKDKATGVMTASRVKPVHSCGQHTAEPLIRVPKTSLISYYPIEGGSENLLVANIHGINFSLGVGVYTEQIEKLYEAMKHHEGPIILAGDFNTWSDKRMRIVDDLAGRLALESLDYTSHNRTAVFGNALDHVFYRGLEPIEHDTWHVTSSDHNPTRVSFRVIDSPVVSEDLAAAEIDDENC